jgi:endonuclease/exonuclease/phosphatase family metal-dependent hydrolase
MTRIRVMSFNIFNTIPESEIEFVSDVWANRAEFNGKTIKRYDPDIIGFQEFEPIHRATYTEAIPEYEQSISNENGEGTTLFWKSARFEAVDAGHLWLPRTALPDLRETEDNMLMSTTWARLREKQSGVEVLLLNTHLNDESETARQEGTKLNLRRLAELDPQRALPVVMTGDFNCNPWSPVYRHLLAEGFVDTYRAAGHGDSAQSSTFHGFQGANYFSLEWGDQAFWRVDWIMARGGQSPLQTTSCTIVRDAEPPIYASDHYPVVTELLLLQ